MAVRVKLSDGRELIARIALEEMYKAYQRALDRNTPLDVNEPDGGTSAVNPMHIVSFEEVDDATADALENGARARADEREVAPA